MKLQAEHEALVVLQLAAAGTHPAWMQGWISWPGSERES